ncbi:MAG: UDP-N-acetylmuramoyl-L-alanyl-D-glutamate--2,6-diaminopimelate ligase, partial [Paludibacter sp.]|nr:UDP-N-acetylmuramoyl-L-alanyl-D-glutamate--2,6-diaminopimelate ligase [Paludibacter sp.]
MLLKELLLDIKVLTSVGNQELEITGIEFDSRKISPGSLFVATRGTTVDGHDFIAAAIEKGAVAVVCEQMPELTAGEVTYIQVANSAEALGCLASSWFGYPSSKLTLVGVTGTNGKTTIATLLYQLFRALGNKTGLLSTVCNYIDEVEVEATHTTPDALSLNALLHQMAEAGCRYAFMEVSSHSVEQGRIAGLKFDGGVFTNLTRDHIDYHLTFENYLKAKKKFFDQLPEDSFALTNADDKNGMVMLQNTRAKKCTYSLRGMADFKTKIL